MEWVQKIRGKGLAPLPHQRRYVIEEGEKL
jgi:hypothetical protein